MLIKFTVLMEMQNNGALRAFAGKNINDTQDKVHVIDSSNFPRGVQLNFCYRGVDERKQKLRGNKLVRILSSALHPNILLTP